jgi:hypothetical protein
VNDTIPTTLYHYTNAQGLLGILKNRNLRATDLRHHDNDLRHATETMVAALRHAADQLAPNDGGHATTREAAVVQAMTLRSTATTLTRGPLFDRNPAGNAYIACFCDDRDQPGQWHKYDADGGGFAVGFRTDTLIHTDTLTPHAHQWTPPAEATVTAPVAAPQPVLYTIAEQQQRCREVVTRILSLGAPAGPLPPDAPDLVHLCLPALAVIKHHAFERENEWRALLVTTADRTRPVRSRTVGAAAYLEIGFPTDAVAEVVIGPGPHPKIRTHEVTQLLRSHGFPTADVRLSTVPYP